MPVKRWNDLKDPVDREVAEGWSKSLDIPDVTTRELERAADLWQNDKSEEEIRDDILGSRKR